MHDPAFRFALLCSIAGTVIFAGGIFLTWHLRRAYWERLRRVGDPRAKEREARRRKRR